MKWAIHAASQNFIFRSEAPLQLTLSVCLHVVLSVPSPPLPSPTACFDVHYRYAVDLLTKNGKDL